MQLKCPWLAYFSAKILLFQCIIQEDRSKYSVELCSKGCFPHIWRWCKLYWHFWTTEAHKHPWASVNPPRSSRHPRAHSCPSDVFCSILGRQTTLNSCPWDNPLEKDGDIGIVGGIDQPGIILDSTGAVWNIETWVVPFQTGTQW